MSKSQSEVSSGGEETVWAAFAMEINLSNLKASTPVFLGLTEGERDKKNQEIILSLGTSTPKGTQTFHPHLQYITDSFPQSGKRQRLKNQHSFYDIITDWKHSTLDVRWCLFKRRNNGDSQLQQEHLGMFWNECVMNVCGEVVHDSALMLNRKHAYSEFFQFLNAANRCRCLRSVSPSGVVVTWSRCIFLLRFYFLPIFFFLWFEGFFFSFLFFSKLSLKWSRCGVLEHKRLL